MPIAFLLLGCKESLLGHEWIDLWFRAGRSEILLQRCGKPGVQAPESDSRLEVLSCLLVPSPVSVK